MTDEKMYTRDHVALLLSVHVRTVDRMIRTLNLPVVKFESLVRIPQSTLDALIKKLTVTLTGGENK